MIGTVSAVESLDIVPRITKCQQGPPTLATIALPSKASTSLHSQLDYFSQVSRLYQIG